MTAVMYFIAVCCWRELPRRSRSGPMQAQAVPQTSPVLSNSRLTLCGSICAGASMGISTGSKHHSLNFGKSLVLFVVKGEVNRNVLMPILMVRGAYIEALVTSKIFPSLGFHLETGQASSGRQCHRHAQVKYIVQRLLHLARECLRFRRRAIGLRLDT